MAKTTTISARIDPLLKDAVERLFDELGLTSSQAITLFYKQVELQRGLPFNVSLPTPNAETLTAMENAKKQRNLKTFNSPDELFNDLNI